MGGTGTPSGPLAGIKVVEFAGIGPAPFAVMLLADLGASVVRILRPDSEWPDLPIVSRGRASLVVDLHSGDGRAQARSIMEAADIVVEGFRPGVMERLGLGPDDVGRLNPRLVYGRITGWGQTGPRALSAGHDINYIAVAGMLASLGGAGEAPRAPLNLLGDYGGGGLYLALGLLAALLERDRSGHGQVVDAAIVDGAASMMAPILGMIAAGVLPADPRDGMLAGSAPFYRTYRCADGRFLAVGPLEPRFRRILTDRLNLASGAADSGEGLAAIFAERPRDEWTALFEGTDACVSPVLDLDETRTDAHLASRGTYTFGEHGLEPAPAPRFSRTPSMRGSSADAAERLREWGVAAASRAPRHTPNEE